jgi:4'-phosphopantetheinyl transferase EntD
LPGPNRAPVWPEGVVGSITHCTGYCAAAVGRRGELRALGIDAELNEPLPAGVAQLVCTEAEVAWTETAPQGGAPWQTLIFSAKESVYKAWQPLTGAWLGYLDAELSIVPGSGAFEARLLVPPQLGLAAESMVLRGRFAITATHVFTAVALPAA